MMKALPANCTFGDLLRHILIYEKRQSLQDVAASLGMTTRGFCARLRHGGRLSPEEVAILLQVIADERLPQWFFTGSGLLMVRHTIVSRNGDSVPPRQRTAACALEAISAICDLVDTLEAGMLQGLQKSTTEERLARATAALMSVQLQLAPPPAATHASPHGDFAAVVRQTVLKDSRVRLQTLADALNLSYQSLHARLSGHVPFLPAELRQMFRMYPDPRLSDYLLVGTPYIAIFRPAVIEARIDDTPIRIGLRALREMVQFLQALLLHDGSLGSAKPARSERHLDEAVRQLATLQWTLTYIGRAAGSRTLVTPVRRPEAA
jgi:hypothetical protein